MNVSEALIYSQKRVLEEIAKCITLCRNCHHEYHYFEKENGIKIEEYLVL